MWVWSLDREDSLQEGMATQSNILVWKIPRTEEPGRLQSMGSQSRKLLKGFSTRKVSLGCQPPVEHMNQAGVHLRRFLLHLRLSNGSPVLQTGFSLNPYFFSFLNPVPEVGKPREDPFLETLQGPQPWDPLTSDIWFIAFRREACQESLSAVYF